MFQNLYISHSKRGSKHFYLDASARYRCIFPCFSEAKGTISHCIHIDQLDKIDINNYQKIVFHRPTYSSKLVKTLQQIEKNGIPTVVDFDDLLFSPEHALENPTYLSGSTSKQASIKASNQYLKALKLFKNVQVSTDRLKEHVEKLHPHTQVRVAYNLVPDFWPQLAKQVPAQQRLENKIIRYFPGTAHHSYNFNQTIHFLSQYLKNNEDVSLEVVGDINVDHSLFSNSQFKQYKSILFDELPEKIASSWVTISPLEDNEFNRCKSGLKFWESGIFGVPVISNNNLDMKRFANKGLLLSNHFNEWEQYLNKMKNAELYFAASHSAASASIKGFISSSKVQHKGDTSHDYAYLSSKIGPNWAECLYNPTNKKHESALHWYKLASVTKNPEPFSEPTITEALALKTEYLKLNNKTKIRRKMGKLKRTPLLFFKDMIKKRIGN